jgi:glycosyltransferase involved in cell wall biosynthesis
MVDGSVGGPAPSAVTELSVVLPAFNEQANVERVVRSCAAYLESRVPDHELLVVNDGSQDLTGRVLERLAHELPTVCALHHASNLGYGAALRRGFEAATKRFVFYMDADGQFDVRDLDRLLPLATDEGHIVTGFRMERRDPPIRRLNAWLFAGFVRLLLGVRVRDLNCAFKLIPKRVLEDVTLASTGALISAELYGRALRRGFGIKEVGVHHYPRSAGVQTGAKPAVILRAFVELVRLRRAIRVARPDGSRRPPTA